MIQGGEGAVDSFLCVCVFVFQGGEGAVDAGQYGAIQHLHRVETVRRVGERLLDRDPDFGLLLRPGIWCADRAPIDHSCGTCSRVRDRSDLVDLRSALSKFV